MEVKPSAQPMFVQFWAISCPICKINLPRLQEFLETYREQGLQLVSVHMPRMEADMDVEKVKAVAEELGLTGPCAIDNDHTLGDRFQTGNSSDYTHSSPSDPCEVCMTVYQDQSDASASTYQTCSSGTTDPIAQQQCTTDFENRNSAYAAQLAGCLDYNNC